MGRFLTGMQEIQQYEHDMYFTKHNQIYEDDRGVLHYTPRYLCTDGYTIDDILAPIAGGKFAEDIRCSSGHDLWCRYKQDIHILISEAEMRQKGILIEKVKNYPKGIKKTLLVCENIPKMYLNIQPINFFECNRLFNEMLRSCEISSKYKQIVRGAGVYLNIGWWLGDKSHNGKLTLDKIHYDFI